MLQSCTLDKLPGRQVRILPGAQLYGQFRGTFGEPLRASGYLVAIPLSQSSQPGDLLRGLRAGTTLAVVGRQRRVCRRWWDMNHSGIYGTTN